MPLHGGKEQILPGRCLKRLSAYLYHLQFLQALLHQLLYSSWICLFLMFSKSIPGSSPRVFSEIITRELV